MIVDRFKGRSWDPPRNDCFSLIRAFFKDNRICEIADYAKPNKWWEDGRLNLYMDNFRREGFEIVDEPMHEWRVGDVILMAVMAPMANHAGILMPEGTILHHFYGRLSTVEPYRPVWRNTTVATVRHPNCPDLQKTTRVNIGDLD